MKKDLSRKDIASIVQALIKVLVGNDMWFDVCIYALGRAYSSPGYFHKRTASLSYDVTSNGITEKVLVIENVTPDLFLTFYGDILSISSEGVACTDMPDHVFFQMDAIVKPYGLYFDFGEHWNMSLYPIWPDD